MVSTKVVGWLFALASVLAAACLHTERSDYLRENKRLLDEIPMFPGAVQFAASSDEYIVGDSGPVDGYTSRREYSAPENATALSILDHYQAALDAGRWMTERGETPCHSLDGGACQPIPWVVARRGEAFMGVNVDNMMGPARRFAVTVDHISDIPLPGSVPRNDRPTPTPTPFP